MTDRTPLEALISFPLHDLVFDCGAAVSGTESTAKLTFDSVENARRFASLVNRVEPPVLGCSIEYLTNCTVASVELAPGQSARKPADPHSMFWSDDLRNATDTMGAGALCEVMLDVLIDRLTSEVEPTSEKKNFLSEAVEMFAMGDASESSIDASKIPASVGGIVRSPVGGFLVLDDNGHVVNLSPRALDKRVSVVSGTSSQFSFRKG